MSHATVPRRTRTAGFTLVEALVSLAVFSLISAGAVLVLIQSVRGQSEISAVDAAVKELQITQALLTADAAQMALRPVREVGEDGLARVRPAFVGAPAPEGLAFVRASASIGAALSETQGAPTDLAYVRYVLEEDRLVRLSRRAIDPGPDGGRATRQVLMRGLRQARFTFFDGSRWVETWPPGVGAPKAVALEGESAAFGGVIRIAALIQVRR